jgi:hypothetical protein
MIHDKHPELVNKWKKSFGMRIYVRSSKQYCRRCNKKYIQEQQEEANMAKYFIHIGGRNYGFYS